jgi:hypothetical protein
MQDLDNVVISAETSTMSSPSFFTTRIPAETIRCSLIISAHFAISLRSICNSNTGGDIVNKTEFAVAENTVLHGPEHPSKLVLPVIRR